MWWHWGKRKYELGRAAIRVSDHGGFGSENGNFIIPVPCVFLQLIHRLKNALNKLQFITNIKILHVSALGLHPQEVKSKAVPLQALSDPEVSRKLKFPDYVTTAQDGGKVVSLMHRPLLPPENTPGTHFC